MESAFNVVSGHLNKIYINKFNTSFVSYWSNTDFVNVDWIGNANIFNINLYFSKISLKQYIIFNFKFIENLSVITLINPPTIFCKYAFSKFSLDRFKNECINSAESYLIPSEAFKNVLIVKGKILSTNYLFEYIFYTNYDFFACKSENF